MTGQTKRLDALPSLNEDGSLHVIVESPRGSANKFKYDRKLGAITLSRPLPEGLAYPHDWGFIPSTEAEDGDPLDAMIVWDGVTYPEGKDLKILGWKGRPEAMRVVEAAARKSRKAAAAAVTPISSRGARTPRPVDRSR